MCCTIQRQWLLCPCMPGLPTASVHLATLYEYHLDVPRGYAFLQATCCGWQLVTGAFLFPFVLCKTTGKFILAFHIDMPKCQVTSQHRDPRKHSGEVPGITPVAAGLSEQLSVEIQLSVVAEYMCKGTPGSAYSLPSDGASGGNDTKVNDSQGEPVLCCLLKV